MTQGTTQPQRPVTMMECRVCGACVAKAQIKKHLTKCLAEQEAKPKETLRRTLRLTISESIFQLQVAVREDATLEDLDGFLRDVWMECCGHMSHFMARPKDARRVIYTAEPEEEAAELPDSLPPGEREFMLSIRSHWPIEKPLDVTVKDALALLPTLNYEYDMGTTTRCTVKLDGEITLPWPDGKKAACVRLLARNARPAWLCRECGEPATHLCTIWDCTDEYNQPARFCQKHAATHAKKAHREEGDDWMISKLSNSPRDPSCGYEEGKDDERKYVWP